METAILLAVAAAMCTATASVCQRKGARDDQAAGFDALLLFRLARRPIWLLGIASMIGGFVFQITALRFGDLALVQAPALVQDLGPCLIEDVVAHPGPSCRYSPPLGMCVPRCSRVTSL